MNRKFTLLLLGPAGSGKSTFVAGLSKLNIFEYITAKSQGGANTTKIPIIYEFSNKCEEFNVIDCTTVEDQQKKQILSELQDLSKQDDGVKKVFEKINDSKFLKECTSITIGLPCKEGLITGSLFDTIVVSDSRGLGDIDDENIGNIDDLVVTYDVNTILFFSISSIQQPAIFSKVINNIMEVNLKTPILLLRRDSDLTQNDVNFEDEILKNISNSDKELTRAVSEAEKKGKEYRLNKFVFNLPEVKRWKGAINIFPEQTESEIKNYSNALKEILTYSTEMYNELYEIIVNKLHGEYQERFVNNVLNNLLSKEAFDVAANIVNNPRCKPSDKKKDREQDRKQDRDTLALSVPAKLYNMPIGEEPFIYEVSKRGNGHVFGTIPSYSYSCVNFRNIFYNIVCGLVKNSKFRALFSTFIDIVLKDYTVTTYTGYTFSTCKQDAFKFNEFLSVRELCNEELKEAKKYNLVEEDGKWREFSYIVGDKRYVGSEAIACLVYKNLIESLDLKEKFIMYEQATVNKVIDDNEEYISKRMSRK